MERIRRRMSFANVISVIALFVALGGASYAAVTLPKNSVGAKQIKKNGVGASEIKKSAVRTGEVKNGALRAEDFAAGQLPKGNPGQNGADGAPGADGTADAFARVDENAARTLQANTAGFPPQVKGIVQANVVPGEGGAATGTTCFDLPSRPASAMVAVDNADAGTNVDRIASIAIDRGEDLGDCPASHNDARVRIIDTDLTAGGAEQDPGPANARFFVWFEY
jgi:hypothetical protein